MKPLRSILTAGLALAVFSTTALRAETFPIFEDAAGSAVSNTIARAAGAAKTLAVSARSNAFINFSVGSAGIDPATVTQARLVIYLPKASAAGTLSIKNLTSGFTETIATKTIPAPTIGATLDTIDLATIPLKGDYFISDITAQVKAWMAAPDNEFGIAITSDGTATATLASKEGAGSGHPAFIEVDVNRGGGSVAGTTATFSGAVTGGSFSSSGAVTGGSFSSTGGVMAQTFTGSGTDLSNLNASNITTGTLADTRLSGNVPLKNASSNAFTGSLSVTSSLGIGITSPNNKLHISGSGGVDDGQAIVETTGGTFGPQLRLKHAGTGGEEWVLVSNGSINQGGVGLFHIVQASNGQSRLVIDKNGNVGIGVDNPNNAKLVVNGAGPDLPLGQQGFLNNSTPTGTSSSSFGPLSIVASNDIACTTFRAYSDARIKLVQGLSDGSADLTLLRGIQVTNYLYKDTISKGNRPQKKVIAQQVEKVFPQAVSQTTDVVPDIYKAGAFQDGWVMLETNLKKGERVRLTDDKTTSVFEVLEVAEGKFRTTFRPEGDKVFVYGREVKDFRNVDYEAIAMLNVSATQELARKLDAKDAEIAALKAANLALTEKMAAFDRQLAALAADRPARTVRASLDLK